MATAFTGPSKPGRKKRVSQLSSPDAAAACRAGVAVRAATASSTMAIRTRNSLVPENREVLAMGVESIAVVSVGMRRQGI